MNRLIILDPSLQSSTGHFLNYDLCLSDSGKKMGIRVEVLGSLNLRVPNNVSLNVHAVYSRGLETNYSKVESSKLFANETAEFLRRLKANSADLVFIHTCTPTQLVGMMQLAETFPEIKFAVFLRYSPTVNPYAYDSNLLNSYVEAIANLSNRFENFYFYTDSELLQREYQLYCGLSPYLLPIPHTSVAGSPMNDADSEHSYAMGIFGIARSTKGFQYIPPIAQKMEKANPTWKLQGQMNVMFDRDLESQIARKLLKRKITNLIDRELGVMEYFELLSNCSLVLLPYQLLYYHSQTSGPFAEATALGIPTIVPRGTWMAGEIKSNRAAGVLFYPGDTISLWNAVTFAIDNLNSLTIKSRTLAKKWVLENNPDVFLQKLMSYANV